jgi:hypothetical protein
VRLTPRVLRLSSRTFSRVSIAATCFVTVGWVVANSLAAFEKLPVSTTRTNISIACKRSMVIPGWNKSYGLQPSSAMARAFLQS